MTHKLVSISEEEREYLDWYAIDDEGSGDAVITRILARFDSASEGEVVVGLTRDEAAALSVAAQEGIMGGSPEGNVATTAEYKLRAALNPGESK